MNKKMANAKSIEGKLSIGQLREMIESARAMGGMSQVNPAFTMAQVCDIYKRAIQDRSVEEIPSGVHYDVYKRRNVPSKDSLIIRNILRDCA
jgi:hypothetical protein